MFTNSVKQEWRKNSGKVRLTRLNYAMTQCRHFNTGVREVFKRVHNVAKSDYINFVISVRPSSFRMEQLGSLWTDFHEIWFLNIFRNSVEKFQVFLKCDKNNECFTRRKYTFFIISRSLLLGMRNVSEKCCRENKNTHFILCNTFFENRGVYELMWKNIVQPDMQQMTVWRMRIACWIPKATNTHTQNM